MQLSIDVMNIEKHLEDAGPQGQVEPQLQATLNLIPAHTWYANASGALTFLNERGSDYLGLPKAHPLRRGISTDAAWDSHISLLHPDDHEETRRVWSTCLRTGCAGQASFRVRDAEGGYRWFLSRAEPVRASDGTLLYWVGINLDIEDRKQAEFYLAEGQRLAHIGSWAFNAAGFDYWSPELFRIHGLDPGGKAPTIEDYLRLVYPEDRESVIQAIQKMLADHRGFDFTKRIVRPDGELRRVRCVGVPALHGKTVQKFVGTGIDVTEPERILDELKRSEFYLAEGQRLSHAGSWSFKPDGTCDYWSRELYNILGFDPKNGIPTIPDYFTRVHPEDRGVVEATIRRMIVAGEGCDLKKRIIRPDGAQRVIRCVGMPIREKGVVTRFVGTLMDITEQEELIQERKRAEEAIRRSESYLAEAQRLSKTGSFAWSPKTDNTYFSQQCYRVLGFEPQGNLPPTLETIFERIHPDDHNHCRELIQKAIRDKVDVEIDYRIIHLDKRVRDIHCVSHVVLDPSGELLEIVGTVIDITERKRAEEAIRRSEAFLAEGQRLSHTGSWGWNALTGKLTWSQEHFQILGLDPQETNPSLDVFWDRVHPDDRIGLRHAFEVAIRDKRDFEQEFRIVTPDWRIRQLHGVGHAVLNQANELVEFVGSTMDITERKRAQERARSQNEAIRMALNAFVGELDVKRFLGDVIAVLAKRFQAPCLNLWLFEDSNGVPLLYMSFQQGELVSPEESPLSRRSPPIPWRAANIGRNPRTIEISSQASLLERAYLESLKEQGIATLMLVPLVLVEKNLGMCELRFQSGMRFTSDDLDLAQTFVHHMTLALQLSRLVYRTEQIAVTEERNRLAREIHDTLAQSFAGIVLHGEVLNSSLGISKLRCKQALSQMQRLARSGLEEARRSVQALRPKALDGTALPEALEQAVQRLCGDAKLAYQFRQRGRRINLSGEAQNEMFRIAQEALTNVVKHAQATSVRISLESQARRVSLSIKDDGIGLATAKPPDQRHGFGMGTMRERAQGIGGRLHVESRPGRGTTIRVEVPLPANRSKSKANQ